MLAMNWLLIVIVFFAVGAAGVFALRYVRRRSTADDPATWLQAEATIQSVGKVINRGQHSYPLDVGDFSYVVNDEYYSGRAQISRSFSTGEGQPKDLVNKKFKVRYNPSKPDQFDVSESEVGGFLLDPYDDFLMQDIEDD